MSTGTTTTSTATHDDTISPVCGCAHGVLHVAAASLSDVELADTLEQLAVLRSRLAAAEAEVFAELSRRRGAHEAQTSLRRRQRLSDRAARRRAARAEHAAGHADVLGALRRGAITEEHADVLAAAEAEHEGATADLLGRAQTQAPDRFRRTARQYRRDRSGDDGAGEALRQHRGRRGMVFTRDDDDMGVSIFELDPVTHSGVVRALAYWIRRLTDEDQPVGGSGSDLDPLDAPPGAELAAALADIELVRRTGRQLLADAYAAMAAASVVNGRNGGPAVFGVRLLLVADYGQVTRGLRGRLPEGTDVTPDTVRRLACDAGVLPAIFDGPSQPLNLGRLRRLASPGQRALLEARDGGCRGCGAGVAFCQAHHIRHWSLGGTTDIDNLVLLCNRCHHLVHEGGHRVHRNPDGSFSVIGPPRDHRRGGSARPGSGPMSTHDGHRERGHDLPRSTRGDGPGPGRRVTGDDDPPPGRARREPTTPRAGPPRRDRPR